MDFSEFGSSDLKLLKKALESGRLVPPYSKLQVRRLFSLAISDVLLLQLSELQNRGFDVDQIALLLGIIINDRCVITKTELSPLELVISGPTVEGVYNRDTAVVVNDLFSNAKQSVLVAGYAVYDGKRIFQSLADRMRTCEGLTVELYLNIERTYRDTTRPELLVKEFINNFKSEHWPENCRLPKIYYYKASVLDGWQNRGALHAKCVVADGSDFLISSANFTKAAQTKNIEIGVKHSDSKIASELVRYVEKLVSAGELVEVKDQPAHL